MSIHKSRQKKAVENIKKIENKKDITLKWRGSSNQRVIDVEKSLFQNKIILYCD